MSYVCPYSDAIKPVREYLVAIPGLYKETIEYGTLLLHAPSNIFNETGGLVEQGVVTNIPLSGGLKEDIMGCAIKFWFTEAHAAYKGHFPKVQGHLLVAPESIIEITDKDGNSKNVGEFIHCSPIELPLSKAGLVIPNIELISFDSLQKPKENWREYYTDRGVVAKENEHFPVGTTIFWGREDNVRMNWEGGFLLRRRFALAWGEDAAKMSYVPPKKRMA